eukprot:CAMPEP_0173197410 /NCGR_PEP_ID=MMETSP1141-20130122/16146_1 /TAXON_ID=483371 /ORGANISM="non described non described, Strain CCMP2298" /LENGTH=91 /DNA_ID=CAMNT_0014122149 /DNA_START=215 /DNA_END=490 /DNA_ORIENTATION=+
MPSTTSHAGSAARSVSDCGSFSELRLTAASVAISAAVRWRMKTGFPLHLTVSVLPSAIAPTSNSAEASASTSADALMLATSLIRASRAADA